MFFTLVPSSNKCAKSLSCTWNFETFKSKPIDTVPCKTWKNMLVKSEFTIYKALGNWIADFGAQCYNFKFSIVIWYISWSMKKLSEPFFKANKIFLYFCTFVFWDSWYKFFLCTCVRRKYNKYLVNNFFLDQHYVFFAITIGYSLIANFDLGKIETAGFRTRSTRCSHALYRKKNGIK